MPKLTLNFNNRVIDSFTIETPITTIGRDSSNTFCIDSLAIAPNHLKVTNIEGEYFIEGLSEQFPIFIANKKIQRQPLVSGDIISIGKHTLVFSTTDNAEETGKNTADYSTETPLSTTKIKQEMGHLQHLNGKNIGLVINLDNAVSELEFNGNNVALIAKRQTGYYLSRLLDGVDIAIGGKPVDDEIRLTDNAKIHVANNKYLFFYG